MVSLYKEDLLLSQHTWFYLLLKEKNTMCVCVCRPSDFPLNQKTQLMHWYGVSMTWHYPAQASGLPELSFLAEHGMSRTLPWLLFPISWECKKDTESDTGERAFCALFIFQCISQCPFNTSAFHLPTLARLPRSPLGLSFSRILRNLPMVTFWFMSCLHLTLKVAILN